MVGGLSADYQEIVGVEVCHSLHYLQMATEKMGKAFLLAHNEISAEDAERNHEGFAKYIKIAARNHALARKLEMRPEKFRDLINDRFVPLAQRIEQLAPALAKGGANPEYPWRDNSGFNIPCQWDFDPVVQDLTRSRAMFQRLIETLIQHFADLTS